jgi:hypothetical protein
MPKITVPEGDWVPLRDRNEKIKSGEGRALFEVRDQLMELDEASGSLRLLQHVAAFLIKGWSYDAPCPAAVMADGHGPATVENMGSFDVLTSTWKTRSLTRPSDGSKRSMPCFKPSREPESPTSASGG